MKLYQIPDRPQSIFLVPEDDRDRVLIRSIRTFPAEAVEARPTLDDETAARMIEEPIIQEAFLDLMARAGVKRNRKGFRCSACDREGKLGNPPICEDHLGEKIQRASEQVVELKVRVFCTCGGKSPHVVGCPARAKATGLGFPLTFGFALTLREKPAP